MAASSTIPANALKQALDALGVGDLVGAGRLCRSVLEQAPTSFDALHLLGLVEAQGGNHAAAERLIGRALEINPRSAAAQLNRGNALMALKRRDEALKAYSRTLTLQPDYAKAYANRGAVLLELGRPDEAAADYRRAVALAPNEPASHAGLGNALKDQGKLAEAIAAYRAAIRLRPDFVEAINNLGNALKEQGSLDQAVAAHETALRLQPNAAHLHENLAATLYDLGRTSDCAAAYRRGLRLKAAAVGAAPGAVETCDALLDLIALPAIYDDTEAVAATRDRFGRSLARLGQLGATPPAQGYELIVECLFRLNHFLLGYQQQNDRALLEDYCAVATALLRPQIGPYLRPVARRAGGGKIRLGVASELLMNHNGANWAYSWISSLPRQDYEFFLYSLNGKTDWLTEKFAALGAYRWLPFRPATYLEALAAIRADGLDVLFLPDIGMTASSRILALTRLAPVQCTSWGHPITSGSAMVDCYLSSDAMEPANGQDHYTETLVRLPDPGLFFTPAPVIGVAAARRDFSLPEDKVVFGSVQALFKYLPSYDDVYARIAAAVPESIFVFVAHPSAEITEQFARRMAGAFARRGVDFEKWARVMPRMAHQRFVHLFDAIDVNLDTIGWNGNNTTMFALTRHCPVVTMPAEFMRGRHGCGILRKIGMDELIARSSDDYVALAVRLGKDKDYRAAMSARVKAAEPRLLDGTANAAALDAFFKARVTALD